MRAQGFVFQAHQPTKRRGIPWLVCRACGLVFLHNALTRWCIRRGCNHEDHPEWRTLRHNVEPGEEKT